MVRRRHSRRSLRKLGYVRRIEPWAPVSPSFETLKRNQVYADCVNLSAMLAPQDEVGTWLALDLFAGARVRDQRLEGGERCLGAVEIGVGLGVDPTRRVADRGV